MALLSVLNRNKPQFENKKRDERLKLNSEKHMNRNNIPARNGALGVGVSQPFLSRFVLFFLTFGLLFIAGGPASAQLNFPPDAGFREDRILVKPIAGVDLTLLHALLGVQVLREYPDV